MGNKLGPIKVGKFMIDDNPFGDEDENLLSDIQWIHLIPDQYIPKNLKGNFMFCFTTGNEAMMEHWLKSVGLLERYEEAQASLAEILDYMKTDDYKDNKTEIHREIKDEVHRVTEQFIDRCKHKKIKLNDRDLIKKVNRPKHLFTGPYIRSSLAYEDTEYSQAADPITTDDVMYLASPFFIPNLSIIQWANKVSPDGDNTWNKKISSAHVPSGVLRLFGQPNYGGVQKFLWGPDGDYHDIGIYGFDNIARSLQQA